MDHENYFKDMFESIEDYKNSTYKIFISKK